MAVGYVKDVERLMRLVKVGTRISILIDEDVREVIEAYAVGNAEWREASNTFLGLVHKHGMSAGVEEIPEVKDAIEAVEVSKRRAEASAVELADLLLDFI